MRNDAAELFLEEPLMSKRLTFLMRRVSPILGAGYLLQAGGCTLLDTGTLGQDFVTSIVNSVISGFVFSLLGVGI